MFAYDQLPKKYYRYLLYAIFAFVVSVVILLVLIQVLGFPHRLLLIPSVTRWTGRSLTLLDPTYATKYIPIIASVSEHQPTTWTTFFLDLQIVVPLAPVGIYLLFKEISDGNIFLILYGTVSWYFAGIMIRLMLTLAPIACILAAEGFSGLIRRFMAYLRYAGQDVEVNKEKKSEGWRQGSSCRDPDARHPARRERSVRGLRESDLLHDALQLHFLGSVLLALHRHRLLPLFLLLTHSLAESRRHAHDPRRLPRSVLLDAHEHRRARQVHVLVGLRLPNGRYGQPHRHRGQ